MNDHQELHVVAFGYLGKVRIVTVGEYPRRNGVAQVTSELTGVAADAANLVLLLSRWGLSCGLVANHLGQDCDGVELSALLRDSGILTTVETRNGGRTPATIVVGDADNGKTVFTQSGSLALTLNSVELDMLSNAPLTYIDAYDELSSLAGRVAEAARSFGAGVITNLGGHDPVLDGLERGVEAVSSQEYKIALRRVIRNSTYVQISCDGYDIVDISRLSVLYFELGAETCLLTFGSQGAAVIQNNGNTIVLPAPSITPLNTVGAGIAFSAGFLYGLHQGSSLAEALNFAVAAGSFHCTLGTFSVYPSKEEVHAFQKHHM